MSRDEIVHWKTQAWQDPKMVSWYAGRMQEERHTNRLKNEIEVGLCQRHAVGPEVLDVGIGTGRASLPLARAGLRVTGIDSSQAMLEECARQAGDLPITLQLGDVAHLEFPDGCFDSLVSLNVLVHFPHWREVLREWARVVRKGGRIIFDIHSLDHERVASAAYGLPPPEEDLSPDCYTCRITADELLETADALELAILAVTPYGGVLGAGNRNLWLHDSLASGHRFERLLSWVAVDERLYAFARFLELEVFAQLTPTATGRMLVVFEKRPAAAENHAWRARMQALDAWLASSPLTYADAFSRIPAWDEGWRARLNDHMAWPRNRVLMHFLLSNFPGRIELVSFFDPPWAATLQDWQRRYLMDIATQRLLRRFVTDSAWSDLDACGVNLRAGLEYELTRDLLNHCLKAFDA